GSILILEAKLYDLELKRANSSDHFSVSKDIGEQLRYTFLHQLQQPFFKLLGLHGVHVHDLFEYLRRKSGDSGLHRFLALRERITDLQVARIVNTDNVSRPRFVYRFPVLRHEGGGVGKALHSILANVVIVATTLKLP